MEILYGLIVLLVVAIVLIAFVRSRANKPANFTGTPTKAWDTPKDPPATGR
jgi:hypothetical protein